MTPEQRAAALRLADRCHSLSTISDAYDAEAYAEAAALLRELAQEPQDEPSPLAGNARIGELHDELAATALRSADHLRRAIKAEAKCEVLELNLESARAELAKVNNEFGSENADWPEAWRRVAEVKERAGRLWRDNETLRAQLATFTPLRAKGVVDADDNLDCWDTDPYEICMRHVAALNEKDPAAMWRVVQLFARDEAVPGA